MQLLSMHINGGWKKFALSMTDKIDKLVSKVTDLKTARARLQIRKEKKKEREVLFTD